MDLLKVTKAEYISDYKISVTFSSGCKLICDLSLQVQLGVFEALKDISQFKKFSVNNGVLEWPDEIDIAPEYLFKIGSPLPGSTKPPEPDYVRWTA